MKRLISTNRLRRLRSAVSSSVGAPLLLTGSSSRVAACVFKCVQVCTSLNVFKHWYTFVFALLLYLCKLLLGQICRRCLCHRNLEVQKTARRSRVRQTDFASWSGPDKLWSFNVNKGIFYTFGFYLRSAGALGLTSPAPAGTSSFWRTKGHTVGVNLARCERFDS